MPLSHKGTKIHKERLSEPLCFSVFVAKRQFYLSSRILSVIDFSES